MPWKIYLIDPGNLLEIQVEESFLGEPEPNDWLSGPQNAIVVVAQQKVIPPTQISNASPPFET